MFGWPVSDIGANETPTHGSSIIYASEFFVVDGDTDEELEIVVEGLLDVSMATGSTRAFLLENEPHTYAAVTTIFFVASLSFDFSFLPPFLL